MEQKPNRAETLTETEEEILRMADAYAADHREGEIRESAVSVAGAVMNRILRDSGRGCAGAAERRRRYMEAAAILIATVCMMEQKANTREAGTLFPE